MMRGKDSEYWDLEKKLENKTKIVAELEEASQNKKSKSKKQIECLSCLKKDGDLQTLNAKVDKVRDLSSINLMPI